MGQEYRIYTKGGDKGTTSLMGGTRVPKYDARIDAYGTLDELNAFLGLVRDMNIHSRYKSALLRIQQFVFTAESYLASENEASARRLPPLPNDEVKFLEEEIDAMEQTLPKLRSFILPGGHPIVSYCHISRTICRRAERLVIKLAEEIEIEEIILRYLNRLSDYLFVLSRKLSMDLGAEETPWNPHK